MPVTFTTPIDKSVSVTSHCLGSVSSTQRLVALFGDISSSSTPIRGFGLRTVDLREGVSSSSTTVTGDSKRDGITFSRSDASHSAPFSSEIDSVLISVSTHPLSLSNPASSITERSGISFEGRKPDQSFLRDTDSDSVRVINFVKPVESHAEVSTSFSYNERTSLELVDLAITWDDDNAVWRTGWFEETKILGKEDQLAIRSLVVDDAKEPCATVIVQYDKNDNGVPDQQSDPIHLGRNQEVQSVDGVPVDEDGRYRLKIMEYSGYNSLYALDLAIVN